MRKPHSQRGVFYAPRFKFIILKANKGGQSAAPTRPPQLNPYVKILWGKEWLIAVAWMTSIAGNIYACALTHHCHHHLSSSSTTPHRTTIATRIDFLGGRNFRSGHAGMHDFCTFGHRGGIFAHSACGIFAHSAPRPARESFLPFWANFDHT